MADQKLAAKLIAMAKADQKMRLSAPKDLSVWDESLDKKHTEVLKRIVAEYGWPTISLVGQEAAQDAWLLAQHADHDVTFQESCLAMLKALPGDEVRLANIAYLEDRVLRHRGKPQLYGTQFEGTGKDLHPQPIKDRARLDARRKAMGLGPFAEYEKLMHEYYGESA